jgi:hypothetical protein
LYQEGSQVLQRLVEPRLISSRRVMFQSAEEPCGWQRLDIWHIKWPVPEGSLFSAVTISSPDTCLQVPKVSAALRCW